MDRPCKGEWNIDHRWTEWAPCPPEDTAHAGQECRHCTVCSVEEFRLIGEADAPTYTPEQ